MFMQSPHSSSASHFAALLGNAGVPDDLLGNIPQTPHTDPLATPRSGAINPGNPDLLSLFGGQHLMTGAPMMPPAALSDSMINGITKARTARISPKQQPNDVKVEPEDDDDDPIQDRPATEDVSGLNDLADSGIDQNNSDSTLRQSSSNGSGSGTGTDTSGLSLPGMDGNNGGQGLSEDQLKFMQMQYGLAAQMYGVPMAGFGLPTAAPAFGMPYVDQANLFALAQQNVAAAAAAASGHGFDENNAATAAAMFGFHGLGTGLPGLPQNPALAAAAAGLAAPLGSSPPIPTKKKRGRKKRKKEESVETDSTVSTNASRGRRRSRVKSEVSSDNDDDDEDEEYTLEEDAALPPSLKKRKTNRKNSRKSTPANSSSRSASTAASSVSSANDSSSNGLTSVTNAMIKNTHRSNKKVSSGEEVTRSSYDNDAMNTAFEYIRSSGIVASNLCAADSDEVLTITNSDSKLSIRIPFGASEVKSQFSNQSGLKYRVDGSLVDIAEVLELFQPRDRGHYTMGLTKSQKLERRKDQNRQAAYRARRRAQFLNGMAVQLNSENVALKNYISESLEREDEMQRRIAALESKVEELGGNPDSIIVPSAVSSVASSSTAPITVPSSIILPPSIPFTLPSFNTNLNDEDTKNSE